MNERLGEIAYDAYCAMRDWKSVKGDALPHWAQQSKELQDAWIAAAIAVSREIAKVTGRG